MSKVWPLIGCVTLLGALGGCGDDKSPPPAAVVRKAAPPPPPAPVETASNYLYAYNPTGKRDPFRSPVVDSRPGTSLNNACADPLCQFDLDQLTLVAVVTGDANPLAMVEDPQGRGYMVHRNTRMGRQGGKVTQILRDSITVTELFTGPDGKATPNPVSVGLKAEKEAEHDTDFMSGKTYP